MAHRVVVVTVAYLGFVLWRGGAIVSLGCRFAPLRVSLELVIRTGHGHLRRQGGYAHE